MKPKYIVFKADEWDAFLSEALGDDRPSGLPVQLAFNHLPPPVDDAEVFRLQDQVAAPVFYAASAMYRSFVEVAGDHISEDRADYLDQVSQHFFEAAERSSKLPGHKLPD